MKPEIVPAAPATEELRKAAFELIAQALREKSPLYIMTVHDATYEDADIGTWEISARKID